MGPKLKRAGQGSPLVESTKIKVTSIRKRILQRVLPAALIPLVALSVLNIGGIFLLQRQTADAVGSAEKILTEEVVEDAVNRAAERSSRDLADYVDQWILRINRLSSSPNFSQTVVETSNATKPLVASSTTDAQLSGVLRGSQTTGTQVLARTLTSQLKTFEKDSTIQILLASEQGYMLGSTDAETPLDHTEAEWFTEARENGHSFRSFVNDGDGKPSFEIATWVQSTTEGGGVIRVRVGLENVQWILDEVAIDDAVSISLVDTASSVLLADTATSHDNGMLFSEEMLLSPNTGLNRDLLEAGTIQNDIFVTSATQVAERMDNVNKVTFDWLVQTNQPLEATAASLSEVREVSNRVSDLRQFLVLGVLAFFLLASLLAFFAIRSVANQITRPIKVLTDQAQDVANVGIPSVVDAARSSEELPELPDFDIESNDELAILAHSMNTMQEAAVDLAAGQAKLRRQNVARTFVSLGRRNQNLLNRQLEFITELEQQESDADALENLFRLDHLATRMRRNAENLLVLAGEQTPRRWGRPIAMRDVLRAAASEIADYPRVRLGEIDPATVSGSLATDLSHLIAELLENAGSFSPPSTPIEVLGQHTSTHYRLAIVDQGIGMDPQALTQVNERLKDPVDFADAPSAYLGLFVVGRLAQEMGITVRLASADPTGEGRRRGTIAFIDLPTALLSQEAAAPIEIDGASEGVAHRTEALDAAQVQTPPAVPTAAPAPEAAPVPQALPTPAASPASTETTQAGFPKRSRGATSVQTTPTVMTPSKPAFAEPAAPVEAPPATEITAAGFPKRGSAAPAGGPAPLPAPPATQPIADGASAPKRDAAAVSSSLSSIREAVARGKAQANAAEAAPAQQPAEAADNSLSPPPMPIAPTAAGTPVPESPMAEPVVQAPQPSTNPTPSGSE